ncbi:MAG: YIP1 family protein [Candidatus Marinimicrobia bacterium]|nr:YIP1 family protein [Candidatus Neomarinimicrobiota bacterium]
MEYICGNCEGEIKEIESGICPHCNTPFESPLEPIPWEQKSTLGLVGAFIGTLILTFTKPKEFFKRVPTTGGFATPMIYALISGLLGTWFNLAWQMLFVYLGIVESDAQSPDSSMGFNILITVLSPLIIPLGLLVGTGIIQIALTILGVQKINYETTFRVICYSSGAAILGIFPVIGSMIGAFVTISLEAMGLREIYDISLRKAIAALILPIIFLFMILLMVSLISSG